MALAEHRRTRQSRRDLHSVGVGQRCWERSASGFSLGQRAASVNQATGTPAALNVKPCGAMAARSWGHGPRRETSLQSRHSAFHPEATLKRT